MESKRETVDFWWLLNGDGIQEKFLVCGSLNYSIEKNKQKQEENKKKDNFFSSIENDDLS